MKKMPTIVGSLCAASMAVSIMAAMPLVGEVLSEASRHP